MKKEQGFTLLELLIVVAIILIIAAIAIPNLFRSKLAADEASAVASLRAINTAEVVYSSTYTVPGVFAASLSALSDGGSVGNCAPGATPTSTSACLIDSGLAAATSAPGKSGYVFTYQLNSGSYTVNADPMTVNTGVRQFFTDQTAVIRQNLGAAATATSSPI